jgi:hypothetical protein
MERKEVIKNLLELAERSIVESELKEKFLWSQHNKEIDNGNEKEADKFKMQFAAQKRNRQDSYEPWKELLEKELSA